MTTVSVRIRNSNKEAFYLQIDPWAGVYLLKQGDEIEIAADSETSSPGFSLEETDNTRILIIFDSTQYYVVRDGKRVHWTDFSSNVPDGL